MQKTIHNTQNLKTIANLLEQHNKGPHNNTTTIWIQDGYWPNQHHIVKELWHQPVSASACQLVSPLESTLIRIGWILNYQDTRFLLP